jgi:endonuclease-3
MTAAAVKRLQAAEPEGLTPQVVVDMALPRLVELLRGVGFYRRKAEHLQAASHLLLQRHGGDIPPDIKGLSALPGVGMKMATICMAVAHGHVTGIGVDTHVHRIANRLGWAASANLTAEATRQQLESWLPRPLWGEINLLLVGFGQQRCKPRVPLCAGCLNRDLCPASLTRGAGGGENAGGIDAEVVEVEEAHSMRRGATAAKRRRASVTGDDVVRGQQAVGKDRQSPKRPPQDAKGGSA